MDERWIRSYPTANKPFNMKDGIRVVDDKISKVKHWAPNILVGFARWGVAQVSWRSP
jgi:acetyl-CoA carboxylase carboxyltransferase component